MTTPLELRHPLLRRASPISSRATIASASRWTRQPGMRRRRLACGVAQPEHDRQEICYQEYERHS